MKKLLLLALLTLPAFTFGQDCSGKIKRAEASKESGNYRLALAQFSAAINSCGEARRVEIEKEVLDIYDRIEKLKDDALSAQEIATSETKKAQKSAKIAAAALADVSKANYKAQTALDSLNKVWNDLEKANADKVRLILADVERYQRELKFDAAVDKIKTAKILRALPDSVDMAYKNLCDSLLLHARADLKRKKFKPALAKIKSAEELDIQTDSVETAKAELKDFLFKNARLDILNTDYDTALEKVNAVRALQVPIDTVRSVCLEIAFCYTETGRLERAADLIDTVAALYNNNAVRALQRDLARKNPADKAQLLRQAMQQLDSQRNRCLLDRYLPSAAGQIPGGTFIFQDESDGKNPTICPVPVKPFQLSTKEVTFFEYDLFCAATNHSKPSDNGWGRGQRPVVDIDWYDAVEYCNWRSRQEGLKEAYQIDTSSGNPKNRNPTLVKHWLVTCNWQANGYRLPSEAEWEFAAGNGEKHTRYAWGNDLPTAQKGGNVSDETAKTKFPAWEIFGGYSDGFAYTSPAGSFPPNDFGLYDMTGNVWEWCWDGYDDNYCRSNKNRNALQSIGWDDDRVLRSGSWGSYPKDCLVSNRFHNTPDTRNLSIGFRLARN